MLITTYGEGKYKILLNDDETTQVKLVCRLLNTEPVCVIKGLLTWALRFTTKMLT